MHQEPDEFALLASQAGVRAANGPAPGAAAFQTADVVEIHGPLDAGLFRAALTRAVAEADTLRITVREREGVPVQRVAAAPGEAPLRTLDLRAHPDPLAAAHAWTRADLDHPGAAPDPEPVSGTPVGDPASADAPGPGAPADALASADSPDSPDGTRAPGPADAPLMTQALIRLADDRYWWYQRVHALAVDAYALRLVGRRVAELYTAFAAGREPSRTRFAPLRAVAEEESRYLDGERYAADREFWTGRMAGAPAPRTLGGPPTGAHAGVLNAHTDLPPGAFGRITRAAATGRATWAELFAAVAALHLHRATGARDLVLGLPLTNRRGPAALRTPHAAVNVLPLRLTVHPEDTGAALLRRVALEIREVRRHQRYPGVDLRRDLGLADTEPLTGPLVGIRPRADDLAFGPLTGTVRELASGPVDDLVLGAAPGPGGRLRISVDAPADRHDRDAVTRHHTTLLHLLDGYTELLLTDPQRSVGTLGALPLHRERDAAGSRSDGRRTTDAARGPDGRHERDAVRGPDGHQERDAAQGANGHRERRERDEPRGSNDRQERHPAGRRSGRPAVRTVPDELTARAALTPDAVAVRTADTTLTFAELECAAGGLGAELARLGVTTGTPVALALPRTATLVVALFAVLGAGGVCQPLDLDHSPERLRAALDDVRPVRVIGTTATLAALPGHGLPSLALDDPAARDALARHLAPVPTTRPTLRDAACLVHAPVPNGRPGGVLVGHASLAALHADHGSDRIAPAVARTGRPRLRAAHTAPFASGTSWGPLLWMVHGHELHLVDDAVHRDPAALTAYVRQQRVDYLDVTPSLGAALLAEGLLDEGHHRPAVLLVGGEPVPGPPRERLTAVPGQPARQRARPGSAEPRPRAVPHPRINLTRSSRP
ncbi:condensation domain-containing protein [Streptomyces sp. JNUCC 64]